MTGTITQVTDDAEWDQLVDASPDGEFYHSAGWLHCVEKGFGVELFRLGLTVDSRLVAGLPIFTRKLGLFLVAGSPLFNLATPQLGPIVTSIDFERALMEAFDVFQAEHRVAFVEIFFGREADTELLGRLGYRIEAGESLNLQVAGRTADQLWQGFEGRSRTAIRKAEKSGVQVVQARDPDFLEQYREMSTAIFARSHRLPPMTARLHAAVWADLVSTGAARYMVAEADGQTLAAALFLRRGRRLYYADAASTPLGDRLGANNIIQWNVIQDAVESGIEVYDMTGSGMPGIARFKRSFGGTPVVHHTARRSNSRLAEILTQAYRGTLPLRRRLRTIARGAAQRGQASERPEPV
jgi:lipid II:glycine glycyltransferase (peptidoglycan interpeptide bridge formation enzyme)